MNKIISLLALITIGAVPSALAHNEIRLFDFGYYTKTVTNAVTKTEYKPTTISFISEATETNTITNTLTIVIPVTKAETSTVAEKKTVHDTINNSITVTIPTTLTQTGTEADIVTTTIANTTTKTETDSTTCYFI